MLAKQGSILAPSYLIRCERLDRVKPRGPDTDVDFIHVFCDGYVFLALQYTVRVKDLQTWKLGSLRTPGHQRRTGTAGHWIISQLLHCKKLMRGRYNAALRVDSNTSLLYPRPHIHALPVRYARTSFHPQLHSSFLSPQHAPLRRGSLLPESALTHRIVGEISAEV